ncbi:MAG: hypothetical protein EOM16_05300 [Bacteroidia bacterium]|nr:hypothetical protein [Bacteroidia bacterium]
MRYYLTIHLDSDATFGRGDGTAGFVDTAMGNGDGAFWQTSPEIAARQIISGIDRNKDVLYVTKRWVFIALVMKIIPGVIFKRLRL